MRWRDFPGGIHGIGHDGQGFAYDNECPRHKVLLGDYRLADRLVTNSEWLEFMADGGYASPAHWVSDGWAMVNNKGWNAPGYWEREEGEWRQMTLGGLVAIDPAPCLGDPAFDAVDLLFWRAGDVGVVDERAERLAPSIGADPERLVGWCSAFAAMVALELAEGSADAPIDALLELASRA